MVASGAITLGSRWRRMIAVWPTPMARASVMKSRERRDSTSERTTRAYETQPVTPRTRMTYQRPEPRKPTIASASRIAGKASWTSARRMRTRSGQPPKYPEARPMTVPMTPASRAAPAPTSSETRVP